MSIFTNAAVLDLSVFSVNVCLLILCFNELKVSCGRLLIFINEVFSIFITTDGKTKGKF